MRQVRGRVDWELILMYCTWYITDNRISGVRDARLIACIVIATPSCRVVGDVVRRRSTFFSFANSFFLFARHFLNSTARPFAT